MLSNRPRSLGGRWATGGVARDVPNAPGSESSGVAFEVSADVSQCEAQPLAESAHSQQYAFRITHAGEVIAEGRAAVMLQGDEA